MTKSKWWVLAALGVSLCLLMVSGIIIGWFLTNGKLPSYTMQQTASTHTGYYHTTLMSRESAYVNDYEEFPLLAINSQPSQMIGRFPMTGFGTSGLYAIPGSDPSAFALEYDPMYQQVFRNTQHPPFDWRTAEFQKMRLMLFTNPIETIDPLIIDDVLTALKVETPIAVKMQADGNYSGYENISLLLFSDDLPGLMYSIGVHIDSASGQTYLAENIISNQWYAAGKIFQEWMNTKP
jgi:hypothetical protein